MNYVQFIKQNLIIIAENTDCKIYGDSRNFILGQLS